MGHSERDQDSDFPASGSATVTFQSKGGQMKATLNHCHDNPVAAQQHCILPFG